MSHVNLLPLDRKHNLFDQHCQFIFLKQMTFLFGRDLPTRSPASICRHTYKIVRWVFRPALFFYGECPDT
jgi:hypothetical protein